MLKYSIENHGSGVVMFRVFLPENLAIPFLTFIEQKSKESLFVKSPPSLKNENYLNDRDRLACSLFDDAVKAGKARAAAISEVNYKLKASGFANSSYDMTKQILQKKGKLKQKNADISVT